MVIEKNKDVSQAFLIKKRSLRDKVARMRRQEDCCGGNSFLS